MAAICVFCSSAEEIDPGYKELAAQLGTELAARGHSLVSGGGSVSMMGAVARAVRAAGGTTLGVIPRALVSLEVADHDADELVVTDDMRQRKAAMDAAADAFVVLPGGLGTLEEFFEIWVAATLGMIHKPIVVLDPRGLFAPLRRFLDDLTEQGFVREQAHTAVAWHRNTGDALDSIEKSLADPGARPHQQPSPEQVLEAEL